MFGGGMVWLYRKLAGMSADENEPGYRHIIFRPQPVDDISYAKYFNETSYGKAGIHWNKEDDQFEMNIAVPVGCHATVYVPASGNEKVLEGGKQIADNDFIKAAGEEDGYKIFKVKSGNYDFSVKN
jgi:alpha-L-rhamnosidase